MVHSYTGLRVFANPIEVLKGDDKICNGLTGGGDHMREYAPNLSDYPEIHVQVEKAMTWYVKHIQKMYPALSYSHQVQSNKDKTK